MRCEDDVCVGAADAVGEQLDEAGLEVPAVDEVEFRPGGERLLELVAIALDRQRGVVRREHQPDDPLGTVCHRCIGGVGDARRPVLHPGEHRKLELALERCTGLLGDRVQRRGLLDPEPAVPRDEILEMLGRDGPPASDVRVVRGHVGQSFGRPVRHQDDCVRHAPPPCSPARAPRVA